MYNPKILYNPTENLSLHQRITVGGNINPILHSEFYHEIPSDFTHCAPENNIIFNLLFENYTKKLSYFGSQIKWETTKTLNSIMKNFNDSSTYHVQKDSLKGEVAMKQQTKEVQILDFSWDQFKNKLEGLIFDFRNSSKQQKSQTFVSSSSLNEKISKLKNRDDCYERQNSYYKTLLRDFRRFFQKDFDNFINKSISSFPSEISQYFWVLKLNSSQNEKLTASSISYWTLKKTIRVKIFVSLLESYCEYLISRDSKIFTNYHDWKFKKIPKIAKFKTEEELTKIKGVSNKERLMIVLGSIIYYKDFKNTMWIKK